MTEQSTTDDMRCGPVPGRAVLRISGADCASFLQGLVTQDVKRVARDGIAYGAMLTPQGKLVCDFFMVADGDAILLDLPQDQAAAMLQKLTMFKLRSAVEITQAPIEVNAGIGQMPDGAVQDPRHPDMGWRFYGELTATGAAIDWDAMRVAAQVPETGAELIPGESFILELGFERLNGLDFRKGCYVGQEVTARMHHKTELRRGLVTLRIDGSAPVGTRIEMADGREAGKLGTQSNGVALALVRFDRMKGQLRAGEATVTLEDAP